MKKITASVLLCAMLAALAACGGTGTSGDTTASDGTAAVSSAPDTTPAPETDRSEIRDDLPEADLEGYVFRMVSRKDQFIYQYEVGAETENGDVVNDAAYKRNRAVSDRLNVEFEIRHLDGGTIVTETRNAVMAGDDITDLLFAPAHRLPQLATEGLLYEWGELEYVDFSRPWWSESALEQLSVTGKTYFATGDICISNIGVLMCMFYNKKLAENYDLGNIYALVNSGKWTYDLFNTMVAGIHEDLNGDSVMDDSDLYGFGNNRGSTLQPFVFALGARYSEMDDDGIPYLTMNTEKFINVFEKIYALHLENDGSLAHADYKVPREKFANGEIVFNTGAVYQSATIYREMKDDFGVVPFPKADEAMEAYYTCHDPNVSLAAVPLTVSDPKKVSLVVEALAAESYRTVTPAFFETALQVKYSRDEESMETLELIREGATFDFAVLYGTTGHDALSQALKKLITDESREFVSYYTANAPAVETYYKEIVDAYKAIK